jgi:homoserine dehydrogenase
LRLHLKDKPGALAKVAAVLGDHGISIDRMRQIDHEGTSAPVIIVTHDTTRAALDEALTEFGTTGVVDDAPVALRIENV